MKSFNPTSPSRRHYTVADYSSLTTDKPYKPLTKKISARGGRNSAGRITMRHQGGGNKKMYRMVDFKMQKMDVPATVETIEYDPYRTAFIALVKYADGVLSYILAPHGMKKGDKFIVGEMAPLKPGNRMKLRNIPVGQQVYSVEIQPNSKAVLARSAGAYVEVLANADGYTDLKMASGEVRRVPWNCYASVGQVSNPEHNLIVIGKAGRSRWLGIRPTVRGKAMNPVDHKYGGGEGSQPRGTKRPKDIWGNITGGRKTRGRRKKSNKFILQRRKHK